MSVTSKSLVSENTLTSAIQITNAYQEGLINSLVVCTEGRKQGVEHVHSDSP